MTDLITRRRLKLRLKRKLTRYLLLNVQIYSADCAIRNM